MISENIKMLQIVANGLAELKEEVVFVGGTVTELYVSNPAIAGFRPTTDVDCVIELGSKLEFSKLEEKLRSMGFVNDISLDAPICRWIYKGIKVDVMPTDEEILGFGNKWYIAGIENKIVKTLPDGIKISVFTMPYYLAAKFEAHRNRGGADLRQSRDFEDIIYILDNSTELLQKIGKAKKDLKIYLKKECKSLLDNHNLMEGVETALPYGSGDGRTRIIEDIIKNITKIK